MTFLIYSSGSLCFVDRNHLCYCGRVHHEERFCEIILNLDHWFKMSFKDISYLELLRTLFSTEQNHLRNFDRVHHEESLCEIILNLDQ